MDVSGSLSISDIANMSPACSLPYVSDTEVLVNTALVARIEMLEAENRKLKNVSEVKKHFTIELIAKNDNLIKLYTGFTSYSLFLAFYTFLGPSVNELSYWGEASKATPAKKAQFC